MIVEEVIQFYIASINLLSTAPDNTLGVHREMEQMTKMFNMFIRCKKKNIKKHFDYVMHQSTFCDYTTKAFYMEQMELDFLVFWKNLSMQ